MPITPYADINGLLDDMLAQMQSVLKQKLVGIYLFGSLVWGDFDRGSSDIDLLVATAADIDDQEFSNLHQMQLDIVDKYPYWNGRIEIAYLSTAALQTFKSHPSKIAIISPGEPFHFKEAGKDWLVNWYMVQEQGRTLFGPAPTTLIDPISEQEFIQTVKEHVAGWAEWIYDSRARPSQAYAILTMCRALYTCRHGVQVSKRKAAEWVARELPEWSELIANALLWRAAWRDDTVDHAATFPETLRFVQFVVAKIGAT